MECGDNYLLWMQSVAHHVHSRVYDKTLTQTPGNMAMLWYFCYAQWMCEYE